MKEYANVWKGIEESIYNDKKSLIFLLADKYYGKTEMLNYFMQRDQNMYRFLIENKTMEEERSLVRICFLKLLAAIYMSNEKGFSKVMKKNGCMNLLHKINLKKAKNDETEIVGILEEIIDVDLDKIINVVNEMLTKEIIINYYVGCYQVFEGFSDDIEYMNELDSRISFNFVIATRPYSGNMYKYIEKFSKVGYFELIIKKLEPSTFRIIESNTYYKMPVYNKLLIENGIELSSDVEQIQKAITGSDYFTELCDEIGYGVIDSGNLLLLSLIMAAGYLSRDQIDFIFKIVHINKHVSVKKLLEQYEFIWDFKGNLFSGSTWAEFIVYKRFTSDFRKQLDSFFSSLLYAIFMELPVNGEKITIKELKGLLGEKTDYKFYVDGSISDAYHLLLSLAVSYIKHNDMEEKLLSNPANVFAVDFLNKYVLTLDDKTLKFILSLFEKTQDLNLLNTYGREIERYIKQRMELKDALKKKIKEFFRTIFSVSDRWCDITLLLQGLKCLDAYLIVENCELDEKYIFRNIELDNIRKVITESDIDMKCIDYFGGFNMSVDVLILIATPEEEKAIVENDEWKKEQIEDELGYTYYFHSENDIKFALARGINKGAIDAAIVAQYFIKHLQPKAVAMVGFAAGRMGKVSLGDVIVPYRVFIYDGGKQDGENSVLGEIDDYKIKDRWKQIVEHFGEEWRRSVKVDEPIAFDGQMIDLLHEFEGNDTREVKDIYDSEKYPNWKELVDRLSEKEYIEKKSGRRLAISESGKAFINDYDILYPEGYQKQMPITRLGIMATGGKVQQWSGIFDKLAEKDRNVCALEMEASGIGKISEFLEIPFIVAKGIGDYARDGKAFDNRFIEYACHTSCRFIIEFFLSEEMQKELRRLK